MSKISTPITSPLNFYKSLPKVELHRHLEGSLRLQTMLEVADAHGITIPDNIFRLSDMVQVQDENGNMIAAYYYDPFGRRFWKEIVGKKKGGDGS